MLYVLTCSCGKVHHVSRSQAGQSVSCSCGQSLQAPTLRGLSALPTVEENSPAKRTSAGPSSGSARTTIIGLMLAVVFLAVPTMIYYGYYRWNLDTSYTEENDRAVANKQFDEATPLDISNAWNDFSTTPLGPPRKPPFYIINAERRALDLRLAISGGIAAAAGIVAVALSLKKK